jgi:hypothetical protein
VSKYFLVLSMAWAATEAGRGIENLWDIFNLSFYEAVGDKITFTWLDIKVSSS